MNKDIIVLEKEIAKIKSQIGDRYYKQDMHDFKLLNAKLKKMLDMKKRLEK